MTIQLHTHELVRIEGELLVDQPDEFGDLLDGGALWHAWRKRFDCDTLLGVAFGSSPTELVGHVESIDEFALPNGIKVFRATMFLTRGAGDDFEQALQAEPLFVVPAISTRTVQRMKPSLCRQLLEIELHALLLVAITDPSELRRPARLSRTT